MTDKVLGLSELKVQQLVQKHCCIINRTDLVPVVTVEERDSQVRKACIDGFAEGSKAGKEELVEWLERQVKERPCQACDWTIDLLNDARKEALK